MTAEDDAQCRLIRCFVLWKDWMTRVVLPRFAQMCRFKTITVPEPIEDTCGRRDGDGAAGAGQAEKDKQLFEKAAAGDIAEVTRLLAAGTTPNGHKSVVQTAVLRPLLHGAARSPTVHRAATPPGRLAGPPSRQPCRRCWSPRLILPSLLPQRHHCWHLWRLMCSKCEAALLQRC